MTDTLDWLPLGDASPAQLLDTRLQAHHAAQALAAFGQNFVEAEPDDSHRSVTWDPDSERFQSAAASDGTRVSLSFEPLELHVVGGDGRSDSLPLMGVTLVTVRAWLARTVPAVTGWEAAELPWPEYDLPEHPVWSGTPFEPHPRAQRSLVAWYSNATKLIRQVVEGDEDGSGEASPIRTWPHGFDMASLRTVERDEDGSATATIGVGLSPGDENYDEPYLYVTVWPHPELDDLPAFDGPGCWHTKGFVGLALSAAELAALGDDDEQEEAAAAFMNRAYGLARQILDQEGAE